MNTKKFPLLPLHEAVLNGELKMVKTSLDLRKAVLEGDDAKVRRLLALHKAVLEGDKEKKEKMERLLAEENINVKEALQLLRNMEDVYPSFKESLRLHHEAKPAEVKAKRAEVEAKLREVEAKLREGLNPNLPDSFGRTALELAAIDGEWEIVGMLLDAGADPNTPLVPLAWAVHGGDVDIVKKFERNAKSKDVKGPKGSGIEGKRLEDLARGDKMLDAVKNFEVNLDRLFLSAAAQGEVTQLEKNIGEIKKRSGEEFDLSTIRGEDEDNSGQTALHLAAKNGKKEAVEILLKVGMDPDAWVYFKVDVPPPPVYDEDGNFIGEWSKEEIPFRTALHLAVEKGHETVVEALLKGKADPNKTYANQDGQGLWAKNCGTALHLAAERGHEVVVEALLKADPKPRLNAKNGSGDTALHMAAAYGHEAVVKALLDADPKPQLNAKNGSGDTALHMAATYGRESVVEVLLKAEPKPQLNVKNESGASPLRLAAEWGHEAVVEALLKAEPQLNAENWSDVSPLHLAAKNGHKAVVEVLLKAEPKPQLNAKNLRGNTALHEATEWGHEEIVKILLNAGADPNAKNTKGQTLFHLAAGRGQMATVEALLKANADLNLGDDEGRTALHHAVVGDFGGHKAVVGALLEAGADSNVKDTKGRTALHLAAGDDFFNYFRGAGGGLAASDNLGLSIMDYVDYGDWVGKQVEIVNILLDEGKANPDERDNIGRTPLRLALTNGHSEISKVLLPVVKDVKEDRDEDDNTMLHFIARERAEYPHMVGESGFFERVLEYLEENVKDAEKLLAAGVVPEVQNRYGQTVLHFAAYSNPLLLKELLKGDNSKENLDSGCKCNLYYSEVEGILSPGQEWQEFGRILRVSSQDEGGILIQYLDFVMLGVDFRLNDYLYRKSHDVFSKNLYFFIEKTNVTPLHLAVRRGVKELVEPLLGAGPDLESKDGDGQTPLHWAAEGGYEEIVKILLEADADPNAKDKKGRTPLDLAEDKGHAPFLRPDASAELGALLDLVEDKGYDAIAELLRARTGS